MTRRGGDPLNYGPGMGDPDDLSDLEGGDNDERHVIGRLRAERDAALAEVARLRERKASECAILSSPCPAREAGWVEGAAAERARIIALIKQEAVGEDIDDPLDMCLRRTSLGAKCLIDLIESGE